MKQQSLSLERTSFSNKVLKGFLWLGTGTFFGQAISWLSTIIVIRLLLPADYGLMAMASTFIMLLTMISELGIGVSIIQAEHISEKEIGQIFAVVIISSFFGWLLCYFAAPLIALFYNEHKLVFLIRVLNINFILIALYIIPQSLFIREMNFKTKVKIDITAQVGASVLTLILALNDMGVWALVLGLNALHLIKAIGFNIAHSSWLKPIFKYKGSENHIKYGLTVTGARLLYYLYMVSDKIIVGKLLGNNLLGIYAVASNLVSIPVEKVLPVITQVSFTSYSRIQNDIDRIRRNLLRTTRTIAASSFPLFLGMACVAPDAIPLILGSKWAGLVVPFQLLCLIMPFKALGPILPPALYATDNGKVNLINMAITSVFMAIAFLIGVRAGLLGICFAWIFAYPIVFLVTSIRSLKVLGIPLKHFLTEIAFPFFASILMLILIVLLRKTIAAVQPLSSLIISIVFGVVFYLGLVVVFKKDEYLELKKLLQR